MFLFFKCVLLPRDGHSDCENPITKAVGSTWVVVPLSVVGKQQRNEQKGMCLVDFHGVCVFILMLIAPSSLRSFLHVLLLKISYNSCHVSAAEMYLANTILEK